MLPTGIQTLDEFLSGGIPAGTVTDIFGPNGTGKTQLLFQLSLNAAKKGSSVLYVDTSGRFRPERILEIQGRDGPSGNLDRITVQRVTNTSEQTRSLHDINSDFGLVLVDNVTDLFSYEYQNNEQIFERNARFMQYMHGLSSYAVSKKIPVIVTNMVRHVGEREVENMSSAIAPFVHIRIALSRNGTGFSGSASWLHNRLSFSYVIRQQGLECEVN